MSQPYAILAPYYDRIGLAAYAEAITPKLLLQAQASFDWLGRKVLDLGCGTGATARFLAKRGMHVTAIDGVPAMITAARDHTNSEMSSLRWLTADVRALNTVVPAGEMLDMTIAIGLVNDLGGLRDIEAALNAAGGVLDAGKMLIFDLETSEGLATQVGTRLYYEDETLIAFSERSYDYERGMNTTRLTLFDMQDARGGTWTRSSVELVRRAYPVQAVAALVARCGFQVLGILNAESGDLRPYDGVATRTHRVMFFCRKHGEPA